MGLPCNNLNLNLYRVFYTVAKTKSFSESSRTLHISQPAISKHIQNLEYELNTLLFTRTNRGIELTPEAKALLVYVEKAYNYLMLGERELQEGKELTKGIITIGTPSYISIYYLNGYIKKFMLEHPNIVIKIVNKDEATLYDLFLQHSLDLLIVPDNNLTNDEIKVLEFACEEYCFSYNKSILGDLNVTNLENLINRNILLPSKKNKQRKKLEEKLTVHGIISNPIMEVDEIETMATYVKEGLGIGYMPLKVAVSNNLEIIKLNNELPKEFVNVIYNEATLTTSSKEFVNTLTNES